MEYNPTATQEDRQLWFSSMFYCPNCKSEKYNYELCPFHQEGKRLLGIA